MIQEAELEELIRELIFIITQLTTRVEALEMATRPTNVFHDRY